MSRTISPQPRSDDDAANPVDRILEAFFDLDDRYVDPLDAIFDGDDGPWQMIGTASSSESPMRAHGWNEATLEQIRIHCRKIATTNEFAINAIENRINYLVGDGHRYQAHPKNKEDATLSTEVQSVVDTFVRTNRWHRRQQEIVRRLDRDGEVFLRFFPTEGGLIQVRFVEPDQVAAPLEYREDGRYRLGIETAPGDVETVEAYWIDGQRIDGDQIQHRKANVDANVKRGISLLLPVRKNLRRAEKLLRNMSVVAEIQSAIALIRKHPGGNAESIRRYVQNQSTATVTSGQTGSTRNFQRFSPGTILDAHQGTEYEFPVAAIDASRYVAILQAELRAIAARLVMPEFMLSSDASSSNYASTMVAEGPAVRMFQRLQASLIEDDLEVMRRVVAVASAAGVLPDDAVDRVQIQAVPPSLAVRDRYKETRADEILLKHGVLSPQTMALRHGLDPRQERSHLAEIDGRNQ
jgi:hypothetical protein